MKKAFSTDTFSYKEGKSSSFFQPRFSINQPSDHYEKEADEAAERVMRMQNKTSPDYFFSPQNKFLQRKCSECEKEDQEKLQRKESSHDSSSVSANAENYISNLSGGKSLPDSTRKFFEPKFNYDFSSVKIHSDSVAAKSAQAVNALAYTVGNNIVFNQNQFSPETDSGKKLLAHELTHVIQQRYQSGKGMSRLMVQRKPEKDPADLDDEQLMSEYESYREYIYNVAPEDRPAEEANMEYFLALEQEVRKRCIERTHVQPKDVSQKLIDRITGKYASIDGDPGEGLFLTPYVASEGQCTIGYGHVIFPKSACTIETETTDDGKVKKKCVCQPPWNAISKDQAIAYLKQDLQTHVNEVHSKINVDLNEAEFDAMVDLAAHVGSLPFDFIDYVHKNWCTDKDAVRERYLRTAIKMKDPDTKQMKVMKNFVERRKRRVW